MLSNTATPYYYGRFRDDVYSGKIPVNNEIRMQMERIDRRILDPRYYYDPEPTECYRRFCENELVKTDGSPLNLLDTFLLWAEDIYGWYYFDNRSVWISDANGGGSFITMPVKMRLTNEQYLIVARGAAKTLYLSTHHAYYLTVDKRSTDQIAVAPTIAQAEETLSPIKTAIAVHRGPFFKMLTYGSINSTNGNKMMRPKLYSSKKGIEMSITNSKIETVPLSIDRLQGPRCCVASFDEWLSCDIRENPINAIVQSASKGGVEDYIVISASSEGTVRNGIGDDIKLDLMHILRGEYESEHTSIWYYKLDDLSEVGDPTMWIKANPNIGKTVSYNVVMRDVKKAEASPSSKNDIIAKRFNLPMQGYEYFFTSNDLELFSWQSYDGMSCALGCDLSQGDDFCSFTFLFPHGNDLYSVKSRSYITQRKYDELSESMYRKYNDFIAEDSLMVMPGVVLKISDVYDDLMQWADTHQYYIECLGYDPYNASDFIARWTSQNRLLYGVEKVIQGKQTETVPLGELKALIQLRMIHFDEMIMQFAMSNCIVEEDSNGNRKLYKKRREDKIDPFAAMMDAYIAFKKYMDVFDV